MPTWKGDTSAKFAGGKFHQNHPKDELDKVLISCNPPVTESKGKKQYGKERDETSENPTRFHLRTFDSKYQKSSIF